MAANKYKELIYKGSIITEKHLIEEVLVEEGMTWFIDSETFNARLEIQNNTLIFNAGTWYNGVWKFGAWRCGEWKYGVWEDGVWFNGVWQDGTFENGIIFNGPFFQGTFINVKLRQKNQNGTDTRQDFIDCDLQNVTKV
jgi:hypothetical protein